ncbi:hypothetical protein PENSPDRAFT_694744 [Peniophora sp. CONT]|nr:hypothetical protein PENSPDRAFT_694744 [Peniophora sp. CONT]
MSSIAAQRPWHCVLACGESYPTLKGLGMQQNSCTFFAQPSTDLDDLSDLLEARKARVKCRRLETLAAQTTPPISFPLPSPSPRPPAPEPVPEQLGRGLRRKRPTWKKLEQLPQPPEPVPPPAVSPSPFEPAEPSLNFISRSIQTAMNAFYRTYVSHPTYSPDGTITLEDVSHPAMQPNAVAQSSAQVSSAPTSSRPAWFPFANLSIFLIVAWLFSGSKQKSLEETDRLVDVLCTPEFSIDDLSGFSAQCETAQYDEYLKANSSGGSSSSPSARAAEDGYTTTAVPIEVPDGRPHQPGTGDPPVPIYRVPEFVHRSIVSIIKNVWSSEGVLRYHLTPFRQCWQRDAEHVERANEEVQNLPAINGCLLVCVVCALMFWSDATHLANFGTASLWPIYLFFGNESKYSRASMHSHSCHHVGYIPKIPDEFYNWYECDWYKRLTGYGASDEILAHCRSQLMHFVWKTLLDADFMEAYEHGIVIEWPDGTFRRVFPRVFTYSADYPEKVLLATVRNMGNCPCPRWTIPKEKIPKVGMQRDDARRARDARDDKGYERQANVAHSAVYEKGKPVRGVDVQNILGAESYVPTKNAFLALGKFGLSIFTLFVVDLMHEFELSVWKSVFIHLIRILVILNAVGVLDKRYREIPTFGRLTLRRFSNNVSAMKKMAAHNWEDMLQCVLPVFEGLFPAQHDAVIQDLVFTLHVCPQYDTQELPKEAATRGKRKRRKQRQSRPSDAAANSASSAKPPPPTPKRKLFNLVTYKLHALGDYVAHILRFGTTDSYSMQRGELEHRRVKVFYARTNKVRPARQISQLELRERALRRMARQALPDSQPQVARAAKRRKTRPLVDFDEKEPLPMTLPDAHHHIARARRFRVDLISWLESCKDDPLTDDLLNARKDAFIMTLAREWEDPDHPYSYAHILGIFHVDVSLRDVSVASSFRPMCVETKEVLWVPTDSEHVYGFLDLDDVIRAAHLIPTYAHCSQDDSGEWPLRYVNMSADRDMVMWYTGIGVGHSYTACLTDNETANAELQTSADALGEEEDIVVPSNADAGKDISESEKSNGESDDESDESDREVEGGGILDGGATQADGDEAADELDLEPEDGENGLNGLTSDDMACIGES